MKDGAIIVAVSDIFFAAKIRATADALSIPLRFMRTAEEITWAAREEKASLIILDLHQQHPDPFQLARELKSHDELRHIRLLGFFSHVQKELEERAREAGFEQVMPRSAFSRQLPEILQGR